MTDAFAFPVLLGDIGGTNARFAQIDAPDAPVERFPNVRTRDYPNFSEAMRAAAGEGARPPKSAVIALAGPITGDAIELTNAPWIVEPRKAIDRLQLEQMVVLNDFEAQSLSLPILQDKDLLMIGEPALARATKVVVGPGTGLGAGALVRVRDAWVPVPGEGGHIDLGPVTERDFAVWPHIERRDGRVSAESLISGSGMVRLYRAVCGARGAAPVHGDPAEVAEAGLSGNDAAAAETLELFATYLGRVAGDLALVFMARGGVYLAGGIPARIAPVLAGGAFRDAFTAKAPHDDVLVEVATAIVTASDAALAGIGAYVRRPDSYLLDIDGRTFRP